MESSYDEIPMSIIWNWEDSDRDYYKRALAVDGKNLNAK